MTTNTVKSTGININCLLCMFFYCIEHIFSKDLIIMLEKVEQTWKLKTKCCSDLSYFAQHCC